MKDIRHFAEAHRAVVGVARSEKSGQFAALLSAKQQTEDLDRRQRFFLTSTTSTLEYHNEETRDCCRFS